MSEADDALRALAALLRADRSVVSAKVSDPEAEPELGLLAAGGPRTAGAPGEYALVLEAVREGYLLHYDPPAARFVRDADADLALLAGDYLYAIGLERLATLGDLEAVGELSDLISLAAQIHDGVRSPERAAREAGALWLGSATAIATGPSSAHEAAKASLRAGDQGAAAALWSVAAAGAETAGLGERLRVAAAQLDFRSDHLSSFG